MHSTTPRLVALASGVGAVAGSYAGAGFRPGFVVAPVSAFVTAASPPVLVTWAIETLGSLGQRLVLVAAFAIAVALFAVVASAALAVGRRAGRPWISVPITAGADALVAGALTGVAGASLLAGVAAGVVVAAAVAVPAATDRPSPDRRRALRAIAAAVGVVGVGGLFGRRDASRRAGRRDEVARRNRPVGTGDRDADTSGSGREATAGGANPETDSRDAGRGGEPGDEDGDDGTPGSDGSTGGESVVASLLETAEERSLDVPGLEGLVSETFYQVDINAVDPDPRAAEWSLRIGGAIDGEWELSYADVLDRPAEHRFVTLRCVGEKLNGKKMDTALWTGTPLGSLLDDVGVPEECCVRLRAADDYYQAFPLSALRKGFLAYRMNGAPLPRGHGHPVRVLVPGHWGEINVKWVTEIEVLEEPATGYWEKRGWHGTGPVETVAKLHAVDRTADGRIRVAGHAYAGTRGVDRVEVSVDGGDAWTEATLSERLPGATAADDSRESVAAGGSIRETAADAWRMWEHRYRADAPHEVVVRAVDGTGRIQSESESEAFPSGPTGWVSRRIDPGNI
jgi:DMSO/TMAO reductase YedYZ molybdopterin-dependent catalytic subunit